MVACKFSLPGIFFGLLVIGSAVPALAAGPSVAFDFGSIAECRDVTSAEAAESYPGEKIVELKLRVSMNLLVGEIRDVQVVRIEVGDSDSRIRVHSFEPGTRLESHLSGDIHWSRTVEKGNTLGVSLGGEAPVPLGDVVAHITPSASGGLSKREVVTERQTRIAPKHVVVASGTFGHEHGVFFKLRASQQSSLEGVHDLTIRFLVPDSWRGDSLKVCCQAIGQEKFLWMKQPATWVHTCAPVAIYLADDREARQAAQAHVESEDRS